jgi:hypothetical protein
MPCTPPSAATGAHHALFYQAHTSPPAALRIALHSIQIVLLLALLVLELILQQQSLLRSDESNTYEPLLSSMGRDEEQAQQAGRRPKESLGRMAIALQSFRYVWPKTSE